ncbi:hypothetical protein VTK73DRAFT_1135 [Phialemonium thermophilum]|uniref:Uncharacterized protein n=1 Tax=Phialemonium thermophilum TaxID=223376 RepID=A0ABR3XAX8_9PEZI
MLCVKLRPRYTPNSSPHVPPASACPVPLAFTRRKISILLKCAIRRQDSCNLEKRALWRASRRLQEIEDGVKIPQVNLRQPRTYQSPDRTYAPGK